MMRDRIHKVACSDPDKPMIGLFLIGCVQTITMTISEDFRVRIKK